MSPKKLLEPPYKKYNVRKRLAPPAAAAHMSATPTAGTEGGDDVGIAAMDTSLTTTANLNQPKALGNEVDTSLTTTMNQIQNSGTKSCSMSSPQRSDTREGSCMASFFPRTIRFTFSGDIICMKVYGKLDETVREEFHRTSLYTFDLTVPDYWQETPHPIWICRMQNGRVVVLGCKKSTDVDCWILAIYEDFPSVYPSDGDCTTKICSQDDENVICYLENVDHDKYPPRCSEKWLMNNFNKGGHPKVEYISLGDEVNPKVEYILKCDDSSNEEYEEDEELDKDTDDRDLSSDEESVNSIWSYKCRFDDGVVWTVRERNVADEGYDENSEKELGYDAVLFMSDVLEFELRGQPFTPLKMSAYNLRRCSELFSNHAATQNLRSITLANLMLQEKDISILAPAFTGKKLCELELHGLKVEQEHALDDFIKPLDSSYLVLFRVFMNHSILFSEDAVVSFISGMDSKRINRLQLESLELGQATFEKVSQLLGDDDCVMSVLILEGNIIDDVCIETLCGALSRNKTLEYLGLGNSKFFSKAGRKNLEGVGFWGLGRHSKECKSKLCPGCFNKPKVEYINHCRYEESEKKWYCGYSAS